MSKLEELIQRYCPDGVEYVKLGDILGVNRGKRLTKNQLSADGRYFVYHGSKDTPLGKYSQFNVKGNTTIVVNTGGIGGVKFCDDDFWCSDGSFWIGHSPRLNDKFVYYYLSPKENYFASQKRVGGVPTIDRSVVENVEIPVPPMPVQEEIVRILDSFTELQAELQAELQKRKQQYNYYLDNLLTFSKLNGGGREQVRWMKMSEVFEIMTDYTAAGSFKNIADNVKYLKNPDYAMLIRTTDLKSKFLKGNFIYVSQSAFDYLWRVKMDKECIVMPNVGNCGEIYYVKPENLPYSRCALAPNAILVRSNTQNNKYLSYCLQVKHFQKQLAKITSPVGQSKFNKTELKNLLIPIPPLSEQERIVSILDRFDKLTNDLTTGLPAEIEKRQQQYEYYRDRLLTFKRKGA